MRRPPTGSSSVPEVEGDFMSDLSSYHMGFNEGVNCRSIAGEYYADNSASLDDSDHRTIWLPCTHPSLLLGVQ